MTQDGMVRTAVENLVKIAGQRVLSSTVDKVGAATERLTDYAHNGGGSGLVSAVTGRLGDGSVKEALTEGLGGGGGKGKLLGAAMAGGKELLKGGGGGGGKSGKKVTNIVERLDVGVPVQVAYNQWTQFTDFPKFMKKVESVEQESEEKLKWRAQVLWSHRDWEATIQEQVPDRRIVWRSKGSKGHVDGAVTFHEIAPELTRIVLVLEYHPQGFFEHTGNLWRAQGRRARLELKHFGRHVMTESVLHADEIKGWRGEIHDGQVTRQDGEEPPDEDGQPKSKETQQRAGDEPDEDRTDQGQKAKDETAKDETAEDETDEADEADEERDEDEADEDEADEDGEEADEDESGDDRAEPDAEAKEPAARKSRPAARSRKGSDSRSGDGDEPAERGKRSGSAPAKSSRQTPRRRLSRSSERARE